MKPYDGFELIDATADRITYANYDWKCVRLRLFPFSANRSARVHKKLVKRFGAEYADQLQVSATDQLWVDNEVERLNREMIERSGSGDGRPVGLSALLSK